MQQEVRTMTKRAMVGLCGSVAGLMLAGMAYTADEKQEEKRSVTAPLYSKHCANCHSLDGKPTAFWRMTGAPDFTSAQWQGSVKDENLISAVMSGKGEMPAFKGKLSEAEAKAIIEVTVRGFGKRKESDDKQPEKKGPKK
jgi:mono/diheme cytochrome c family protein